MTSTQKLASERNWMKARLLGITFNVSNEGSLADNELELMGEILAIRDKLIAGWDDNSIALGFHLKPYKCHWCSKRSNKQYILEQDSTNCCLKHYNEFSQPS